VDRRHGARPWRCCSISRSPLPIVSKTLGHSTVSITADVYTHMTETNREHRASERERLALP
jgi:integrase